ncbi:MAG: ABC transporter ATP-binding protein [Candidatus Hydrogenedentes bacterium]|nr:ABC transporter ATP-binding protein [Candidatus Hydrogenedentota bacterium]
MDQCIETFKLQKTYGDTVAVADLDLQVRRGCFYGFLGPNGAGKSTTIKMLTGIVAPTSGDARILGHSLRRHPLQIKRRIGVVPEDLCVFENLTAREYLAFVGRMYKLPRAVAIARAEELLALLGLADANRTLILEFSHGMKKKIALAAALIHDPDLLFLDEPFEGIDAVASRTIKDVLLQMTARGRTIFLTSHILAIVEQLCTHVGIIHEGRLIAQGALADVAAGESLETRFVRIVGREETPQGLSWLARTAP